MGVFDRSLPALRTGKVCSRQATAWRSFSAGSGSVYLWSREGSRRGVPSRAPPENHSQIRGFRRARDVFSRRPPTFVRTAWRGRVTSTKPRRVAECTASRGSSLRGLVRAGSTVGPSLHAALECCERWCPGSCQAPRHGCIGDLQAACSVQTHSESRNAMWCSVRAAVRSPILLCFLGL